MTSGDPGLAMPSKMFSSEGGILHLQMLMEKCISIAGLWQCDSNLSMDHQAWTRQLKRKVNRHCPKEIRCNSFFLRPRKHLPPHPPYCCRWSSGSSFSSTLRHDWREKLTASTQVHPENAPKFLSACVDIYICLCGAHKHTDTKHWQILGPQSRLETCRASKLSAV